MLLLNLHIVGTVVGGLLAVAAIIWWFHPRRSMRQVKWVGLGTVLAFVVFIGLVCACHLDRPAVAKPLNSRLQFALGTNATRVTMFNEYDIGGFVDREYLWRIKIEPELVPSIVSGLNLQTTNGVPAQFWKMSPHYWPHSLPAGAELFQSPEFSWTGRGPDGDHYFLLHDKAQGLAFVWFKSNF